MGAFTADVHMLSKETKTDCAVHVLLQPFETTEFVGCSIFTTAGLSVINCQCFNTEGEGDKTTDKATAAGNRKPGYLQ